MTGQHLPLILVAAIALASHFDARSQQSNAALQPARSASGAVTPSHGTAVQKRMPIPIAPPTVREFVKGAVDDMSDAILEPGDVGKIKDKVQRRRQREMTPSYPGNHMPKPIRRSIVIDPDPTQAAPVVRLSAATITSFVFSDSAGNAWNIESKSFDPGLFSDGSSRCGGDGDKNDKGVRPTNILNLYPCDQYSYGNVVVTLRGFPAPITFMLATGRSNEVDVGISARVRGVNPDAKAEIVLAEGLPEHDPVMQDFLDGVPPTSAMPLKIAGNAGQVWLYGGAMYFRSRFQVYAPAFRNHVGSADGMHVYKFVRAEPILTVSNNGRPDMLNVTGY